METTMSNTTLQVLSATLVLLSTTVACRDPLPCPDCDEADIAESPDDAEPTPDLPCSGADLMNDNDNCGSCGNECPVWFEGTDWEAGTCVNGVCGPYWTECLDYGDENCVEICARFDRTCVAQGCSGMTGALYYVGFEGTCRTESAPAITMTGSCEEPIPWESDVPLEDIYAMCCCE